MIIYTKWLVRVVEFEFDEDAPVPPADIVRQLWRSFPADGSCVKESFSLIIELTANPQTLLSRMHPNVRYAIRRAERDHLQYDFWCVDNPQILSEFCLFYDRFAASSKLPGADWNRLYALAVRGLLDLSRVSDEQGRVLVWHAHYHAAPRARLLHSASLRRPSTEPALRSAVGRANCYLTWQDMLRFQRQGVLVYDLGGWYVGTEDKRKLGINRFKASFGGVIVREFNSERCVTAIGRLALVILRSYRYCARRLGAACGTIVRQPAILARSKGPSLISSNTQIQHCGGPSRGLAALAKPPFAFHAAMQDGDRSAQLEQVRKRRERLLEKYGEHVSSHGCTADSQHAVA